MFDVMLSEKAFDSTMMLLGAERQGGEWVFDSPDERHAFTWRASSCHALEGTVVDKDGDEVAAPWEFALSESTNSVLWLTEMILEYLPCTYYESLREWVTAYVTAALANDYLWETNVDTLRCAWATAGLRFRLRSECGVTTFEWPLVDNDDKSIVFGMRNFDLNDVLNAYTREDMYGLDDWIHDYAPDIARYLGFSTEPDDEGDEDD